MTGLENERLRMNRAEKIISEKLWATRTHCRFKNAWLPRGWACVEIESFAKDLAKSLKGGKK